MIATLLKNYRNFIKAWDEWTEADNISKDVHEICKELNIDPDTKVFIFTAKEDDVKFYDFVDKEIK